MIAPGRLVEKLMRDWMVQWGLPLFLCGAPPWQPSAHPAGHGPGHQVLPCVSWTARTCGSAAHSMTTPAAAQRRALVELASKLRSPPVVTLAYMPIIMHTCAHRFAYVYYYSRLHVLRYLYRPVRSAG